MGRSRLATDVAKRVSDRDSDPTVRISELAAQQIDRRARSNLTYCLERSDSGIPTRRSLKERRQVNHTTIPLLDEVLSELKLGLALCSVQQVGGGLDVARRVVRRHCRHYGIWRCTIGLDHRVFESDIDDTTIGLGEMLSCFLT